MFTALATIFGALAGLVPAILQFFTLKTNNAHAIELKRLDIQAAKEGVALQIDLENVRADVRQYDRIYDFANAPTGVRWIDALAVLVRPYITLVMFHTWLLMKVGVFVAAVNGGLNLAQVVGIVWDEPTTATFGAIMGFWFGNRMSMRNSQMAATLSVTPTTTAPATVHKPSPSFIGKPVGSRD